VASTTIAFGLLMIGVGVGGYLLTGRHPTALIPAAVGAVFVLLGALARNDRLRKHVMHLAAALALVGFVAMAAMGWVKLARWAAGTEPQRPAAVVSQSILGALLLIFLILCVRSFISARRARAAGMESGAPPM
jgi:hypothetical protein